MRTVPVTVPRVSRSCEHFPDVFDSHLLQKAHGIQGANRLGGPRFYNQLRFGQLRPMPRTIWLPKGQKLLLVNLLKTCKAN